MGPKVLVGCCGALMLCLQACDAGNVQDVQVKTPVAPVETLAQIEPEHSGDAATDSFETQDFGRDPTMQEAPDNQRPRVRNLQVQRRTDEDGREEWFAEASGDDPDGDELEFRYTWIIDGAEDTNLGASVSTNRFKRGDTVRVRVVAFDGTSTSRAAESGTITVANASPEIVTSPPRLNADGHFIYSVKADDLDGDVPLHYELATGPRGMTLDRSTGELRWTPESDQAGKHRVEIVVEDEHGGRATQEFILPIVVRSDDWKSSPASVQ